MFREDNIRASFLTGPVISGPALVAYRKGLGVDDALLHMIHRIYNHLEKVASYIHITFFDFSSAFNTIQPHLLASKLINCNVHNATIKLLMDYLIDRPQYVRRDGQTSDTILTKTGAPQGTVLAPFLFSLFTADYRCDDDECFLQKYADNSALVSLIINSEEQRYQEEVDKFVKWCEVNHLILNVNKTKELVKTSGEKMSGLFH